MRTKQLFTLLLGVILLVSACSPAASGQELAGTRWQLRSIDGSDVAAGVSANLNFEAGGQVGGSGGCNSFGGSYQADAATGTISFAELISTLMACLDGNVMQVEVNFFAALNGAASYQIQGDTLTISGGGHVLVFHRTM